MDVTCFAWSDHVTRPTASARQNNPVRLQLLLLNISKCQSGCASANPPPCASPTTDIVTTGQGTASPGAAPRKTENISVFTAFQNQGHKRPLNFLTLGKAQITILLFIHLYEVQPFPWKSHITSQKYLCFLLRSGLEVSS